jgi:restriction system protein
MARRRTGLAEELFDSLQELPWWGGVIAAGVFWFVGMMFRAIVFESAMMTGLRPLFGLVFNGLVILSLLAAAASARKARSRRALLDRQVGVESLKALSWQEFEQLVGEAYRRRGYAVEEIGGGGPDGGVDLVMRGNGKSVLVQCKRWRTQRVGVDKVRELYGVLSAEGADRGILVSSGHFTKDAQSFAAGKPLELVDGPALAELVKGVQCNPQTQPVAFATVVSADDPNCPNCESPMVLRTAKRGANAGSQFYGCSQYPKCRGIRSLA